MSPADGQELDRRRIRCCAVRLCSLKAAAVIHGFPFAIPSAVLGLLVPRSFPVRYYRSCQSSSSYQDDGLAGPSDRGWCRMELGKFLTDQKRQADFGSSKNWETKFRKTGVYGMGYETLLYSETPSGKVFTPTDVFRPSVTSSTTPEAKDVYINFPTRGILALQSCKLIPAVERCFSTRSSQAVRSTRYPVIGLQH